MVAYQLLHLLLYFDYLYFSPRGGISIDPYANWGKPGTPWRKTAEERLMYHDMNPELIPFRR